MLLTALDEIFYQKFICCVMWSMFSFSEVKLNTTVWVKLRFVSLGIHHRHLFCSDLVRQKIKIQQHNEGSTSQQQHGWKNMDPRYFLSQLKEGRCPLDHHTQSHAQDMEWRQNTLHAEVKRQWCWSFWFACFSFIYNWQIFLKWILESLTPA